MYYYIYIYVKLFIYYYYFLIPVFGIRFEKPVEEYTSRVFWNNWI